MSQFQFLNERQAAALLGVHRNTLLKWRHEGNGPPWFWLNPTAEQKKGRTGHRMIGYLPEALDQWKLRNPHGFQQFHAPRPPKVLKGTRANRFFLTDAMWDALVIEVFNGKVHRLREPLRIKAMIELTCQAAREGIDWTKIPEGHESWNGFRQRNKNWAQQGIWQAIFECLGRFEDFPYKLAWTLVVEWHSERGNVYNNIEVDKGLAAKSRYHVRRSPTRVTKFHGDSATWFNTYKHEADAIMKTKTVFSEDDVWKETPPP